MPSTIAINVLADNHNRKGFSLKRLKYLVMDEADRLLDLDFGPILDKILKVLPREGRHTYLFSATMSTKVESLQRAALQNPVRVSISSSSHQVVSTLVQRYVFLPHKYKDLYLIVSTECKLHVLYQRALKQ